MQTCRRPIHWTKQQARDWDIIKYCSDACRGPQPTNTDQALESAILELLADRGPNETIDPSEAAKLVGGTETRQAWESLLEPARAAARRLSASGKILITQHGHPIDSATAKGPIRLRLC